MRTLATLIFVGLFAIPAWADNEPHWAFQPIREVNPPKIDTPNPIDRFITTRQASANVKALNQADRRVLIRRASFDLIGLPPTPAQIESFLADRKPGAFDRLVNELLGSPRYGERWGRHWLDLARYADTAGENSDYPIPEAYRYRDYVIDSFNADKPYDQFIHEQIAGDILGRQGKPEDYAERLVATGFLAQAKRFGTGDLEDMHLIIEDTLDTMGKVVLGVGLSCARCHDHKYDPTSMKDYYGLYAFFQRSSYPYPGGESARVPKYFKPMVHPSIIEPKEKAFLAEHHGEIDRLKKLIKGKKDTKANQAKLDAILSKAPSATAPLAYAVSEGKVKDTYVHKLGNPRSRGDKVSPGIPAFLGGHGLNVPSDGSGRLELARWLTAPDNPLTARVMVNRIWQFHFGQPIVPTPSNFGLQGEPPSHPDLLDWLATQFMANNWSIKDMHRLIMSSQAYQRASDHDAENFAKDSDNSLFWRFDRRRLDAESIRDSMLMLGGNLDLKRPGPHPFPSSKKWRFSAHRQFKAVYPSNHRSVYLMVQRLHPHPFLAIFNGPDTNATTAKRDTSTVPLQALFMSNSTFVEEQSKGLAKSLIDTEPESRKRIEQAYSRVMARGPNARELQRAEQYLRKYQELLAAEGIGEEQQQLIAWSSYTKTLLTANEFVFVN